MSLSKIPNSSSNTNSLDPLTKLRIQADLKEILRTWNDSPVIFADSDVDDLLHIEAAIEGPPSTPYENAVFLLGMRLPNQFPFLPPRSIIFKRATMHPNVDEYGNFKSDLLKSETWSPAMTIKTILEHVWARLAVPDVHSNDCDPIRADLYRKDKDEFERIAREYSIKYSAATESK